jgi:DNA mismatch endonuclease Vsr
VFAKERFCIFVDGCFWHGCAKCYRRPSSNETYWDAKIVGNRERDQKVRGIAKNGMAGAPSLGARVVCKK